MCRVCSSVTCKLVEIFVYTPLTSDRDITVSDQVFSLYMPDAAVSNLIERDFDEYWSLISTMRHDLESLVVTLSRWAKLLSGLALLGLSIAFMKQANLGLGPWDVLSDGLAGLTGMQLGTVSIIVGAIVLLLWIPMREKPGIALIPNILLIGAFTNIGLAMVQTASGALLRTLWLISGLMLAGFGTVLYLGSQLGAGPRDGLMLGISRKTGWSVRVTRTALEVFVLVVGWILGGAVGIGTVIVALTIGPAIQFMADKAGQPLGERVNQSPRLRRRCG